MKVLDVLTDCVLPGVYTLCFCCCDCRCFMAGSVPELASGVVGSAHHLHVGRMVWGWLLWVSWQAGLLYDNNETKVGGCC